jgi:hypothetical protein
MDRVHCSAFYVTEFGDVIVGDGYECTHIGGEKFGCQNDWRGGIGARDCSRLPQATEPIHDTWGISCGVGNICETEQ